MADHKLQEKMQELDRLQGTMPQEEFIAKVDKELRPLWEKELLAHGAHEPDWVPLEKVVPLRWCGGFMFMGYEGNIRIYKQGFTRECLYLDVHGNAYARGPKGFIKVPTDVAVEIAFVGIEELGWSRSSKYSPANAAKRREMLEAETGYRILTFGDKKQP